MWFVSGEDNVVADTLSCINELEVILDDETFQENDIEFKNFKLCDFNAGKSQFDESSTVYYPPFNSSSGSSRHLLCLEGQSPVYFTETFF